MGNRNHAGKLALGLIGAVVMSSAVVASGFSSSNFEGALAEGRALAAAAAENAQQRLLDKALREAAGGARLEEVRRLVKLGANPNADDQFHFSPLVTAAYAGYAPMIDLLVSLGAEVNRKGSPCGGVALHAAASSGHLEAVKALLAHRAELDARACLGATPLLGAAEWGRADVFALLLKSGADLNAKNADGASSLHFVTRYAFSSRVKMLELLLADPRLEVNGRDKDGMTPLKNAVKSGSVPVVKALLAAPGLDLNDDGGGVTALFLAELENRTEIAALLRSAGANAVAAR